MSKGFFIDTTRCIACKGCQVACKAWNRLPAEKTENQGNLQNPPDFSFTTYKLVRMNEEIIDGKVNWLFFPDQCRHCLIPPCLLWAQNKDAIFQDKDTGAVVYTSETQNLKAEEIIGVCPYDVPRRNKNGFLAKCTMCNDRVKNGMDPACVKTNERLEKAKLTYPAARLLDSNEVRVIFLTAFAPEKYHTHAAAFDAKRWKKSSLPPN
jgi:formate dehydrogenase iron-sulfur subunit